MKDFLLKMNGKVENATLTRGDDLYIFVVVEFGASKWITTGRPVTLSRPSPVRGLLSLIS